MMIFYTLKDCPYCQKAMVLLDEEINKGLVLVQPHTKAPSHVQGFPYFVNGNNTYTGLPTSKIALFKKLGKAETYKNISSCAGRDCASEPRWPGQCNLKTYGWWSSGVL